MAITKVELKDYYSSYGDSEGGVITDSQIPTTELAAQASSGSTSITVYDAGGFTVGDTILIDDGTNKERKTITDIGGTTFSLDVALMNTYDADTPVAKKNNLFDDITPEEATSGTTKYKKYFRKNTNNSSTWEEVKVWIEKQPVNAAVSVGLGLNDTNDNDSSQGNMSNLSSNSQIALVSDGTDTRQVTLKGLDNNGILVVESVTLNGTTEVLSSNTYSKLYLAYASTIDSNRTITLKQGSGGSTIGTIGPNKICSWLWMGKKASGGSIVNAEGGDIPDENSAIKIGDIASGRSIGLWVRLMVPAGSSPVSGNDACIQIKGQTA